MQRIGREADAGVGARILRLECFAQHGDLASRLIGRHTRLQSRDGAQVPGTPGVPRAVGVLDRDPEALPGGIREAARHDANNRARRAVDGHAGADDVRTPAEALLPEPVREYHDLDLARLVLVGRESPAEERVRAENGEEARADLRGVHADRIARARNGHLGRVDGGGILERARLPAQVEEVRRRHDLAGPFPDLVHPNQAVGFRIG